MNGQVKNTKSDKGFGFITGEDGKEYFFHITSCAVGTMMSHLKPGTKVTFEPVTSPKGVRAEHVSTTA